MMKKIYSYLWLPAFLCLMISCKEHHKSTERQVRKLDQLHWMVAHWEMLSDEGKFTEDWEKINDTLMDGDGIMINNEGDTIFMESMQLTEQNDTVFYVATVPEQNDGKPVSFMMHSIDSTTVVFENKAHDFPQRIIYNRLSDAAMIATIEGLQNGVFHKEVFHFNKTQ